MLEGHSTLDKRRLREKMGHLDDVLMQRVNNAITISFGLGGESEASADISASAEGGVVTA